MSQSEPQNDQNEPNSLSCGFSEDFIRLQRLVVLHDVRDLKIGLRFLLQRLVVLHDVRDLKIGLRFLLQQLVVLHDFGT